MGIIINILFLVAGGGCGVLGYYLIFQKKFQEIKVKQQQVDEKFTKADSVIAAMKNTAEQKSKESENRARELEVEAKKDIDKRMEKITLLEERLIQKDEKIEQKSELLEQKKEQLAKQQEELEKLIDQEKVVLSQVAGLSPEEAKKRLFETIEQDNKDELVAFLEKRKNIKKEDAEKESIHLFEKILPRVASNVVSEFTTTTVDIPTEDTKGRLIGREGRNVMRFEKTTGVELLIDDTPLAVRLSSYNPEKRFLAAETLKKLIKDGRINPFYIEKTYTEVVNGLDALLTEKGMEALDILNLPPQHPDIVKMIGQFTFRYSYGQNLWQHSIEVAKIAEVMANEMGLDPQGAKKAGLLHDIGKIIAGNGQSHTKVGADMLRKYGYDAITVNTAEAHHHDIPLTDAIGRIVTAADAISASRPGARFNSKEFFIEKMGKLEQLINEVAGVDKVYIMQAGREIMIFVNPAEIDDLGLAKLLKTVGEKVEAQLDYPGIIRVVGIREQKVVDYLR